MSGDEHAEAALVTSASRTTPGRRRALAWRAVAATIAVGAIVAVAAGSWWWTHPSLLPERLLTVTTPNHRVSDGVALFGLPDQSSGAEVETVTVTGHHVGMSRNTAEATGSLSVCRVRDPENPFFGGGTREDLVELCSDVRPLSDGTRLRLGRPVVEYLVLEVTPARPGVATVDDIAIAYRRDADHLSQRGTQHLRGKMSVRAR